MCEVLLISCMCMHRLIVFFFRVKKQSNKKTKKNNKSCFSFSPLLHVVFSWNILFLLSLPPVPFLSVFITKFFIDQEQTSDTRDDLYVLVGGIYFEPPPNNQTHRITTRACLLNLTSLYCIYSSSVVPSSAAAASCSYPINLLASRCWYVFSSSWNFSYTSFWSSVARMHTIFAVYLSPFLSGRL